MEKMFETYCFLKFANKYEKDAKKDIAWEV